MIELDAAQLRELVAPGVTGPLSSVEKVAGVFVFARTYRPRNSREALVTLGVRPLLAMVELPQDPAELDAILDAGVQVLQALKSDPPAELTAPMFDGQEAPQ